MMEIQSVRGNKNFVGSAPSWESLIKDKQRTTEPLSNIEDPIKRNKQITFKAWKKNNPEKYAEYLEKNKKNVKAWAEAHPERIRELGRKNDEKRKNSPKRKAWQSEYNKRPEVVEKHREYDRKRNKTPERLAKYRIYGARKRAKKKGAALFAILCNIPEIKEAA